MARAKHTDRTEARRRYRAEQASADTASPLAQPLDMDTPAKAMAKGAGAKGNGAKGASQADGARPGIMNALRASFRPVDLRGDLRELPVIVRHWAVLGASAAAILSSAWLWLAYGPAAAPVAVGDMTGLSAVIQANSMPWLLFSLAVSPPAAAGAFLIGFTARRASWLGGLVFGVVAAVCYSVLLATSAGRLLTADNPIGYALGNAWFFGPLGAMLFASAAAWYKRFLNLANPNRGRRPAKSDGRQKGRPGAAKAGNRAR